MSIDSYQGVSVFSDASSAPTYAFAGTQERHRRSCHPQGLRFRVLGLGLRVQGSGDRRQAKSAGLLTAASGCRGDLVFAAVGKMFGLGFASSWLG